MLGFIQGKVLSKSEDTLQCVLLAGDLGYELIVPRHVHETLLPETTVSLWVHTHVREDQLTLYGFATEDEKKFFRVLITVSGLGPKMALGLLTEHGTDRLIHLIARKEATEIAKAKGVGKRIAEKICLELTDKVQPFAATVAPSSSQVVPTPREGGLREDLASALLNLGYQDKQVRPSLERLFSSDDVEKLGFESGLKAALKEISGHG